MQYRQEICDYLEDEFSKLSGEIECDESYFGGRRKGNRGRGAKGKVTVFGMLERKGKIYTTLVDNVSAETIMGEIKRHAEKGSVFYTDKFRSYKSLTFFGKHITVDHGSYLPMEEDILMVSKASGLLLKKGSSNIMVYLKDIS